MPPLRERGDDVLLLADYYINLFNERLRLRRKITGLTPEVAAVFRRYRFPGNVRELRNIIERALILEESDSVTMEHLPRDITAEQSAQPAASAQANTQGSDMRFTLPPQGVALDEVEATLVRQAMEKSGGNQTRAAELLSISRDQLRYRLKKLDDTERAATETAT